jgi:shikimate kinase
MTDSSDLPSRIYLVGFMGCGKTRIGRLLADAMGRGFLDVDTMVKDQAGKSIREIFERQGETAFRQLETDCLRRTEDWDDVVVATGGGVMASETNRQLLAERGTTVWLNVPFEVIVGRMSSYGRSQRPLLDDEESARRLYAERLEAYCLSDLEIAVAESEDAQRVAARILDLISSGT